MKIKIESVELYHLQMHLKTSFKTSFGEESTRHPIIVVLRMEEYEGYGEAPGDNAPLYSYESHYTILYVLKNFLIPHILGKSYTHPEEFYNNLQIIRGHNFAKTALEYAFWDLYAKVHEKPLYKLYGGVKKKIPVGVSIGIHSDTRRLIDAIEKYLDRGYKRIKLKIKPGYDINILKEVRETFGDIPLQVDANASYNITTHQNILQRLDKFNLIMIEQPLHYEDLVDHAKLRAKLQTPICLDESIPSYELARAALELGSMDILNIKPPRVGGITSSLLIYQLLSKENIGLWVGGLLETGIGKTHLLHIASLPKINYPSDISESARYWYEDIIDPPLKLNPDGTISVPSKYGIGANIDYNALDKYARDHWVFR